MRRFVIAAAALCGCRIDPVASLEYDEEPTPAHGSVLVIPWAEPATPELQRTESLLRRYLGALAGPGFTGRRNGSDGARRTVQFLVRELDELGVQPAAESGGWLQRVPLRVVRSSGEVRLRNGEETSALSDIHVARTTSAGPFELAADLTVLDYGITAPKWGVDDYAGKSVQGGAVLVRAGVPADRSAEVAYASREYKYDRALRAGAAACLVSIDENDWDAAVREFTAPRISATGADAPAPPSVDAFGIVSAATAQQLRDAASRGDAELVFDIDTEIENWQDHNVIGRIPGAEHPEQSVVVVAHWDAGGYAAPREDGAGANDNASGVAIAMAAASRAARLAAAGRRPRRSVVFVFTAAGSLGGLGAQRYLAQATTDTRNVAAVVVLDGFDLRQPSLSPTLIGAERSSLEMSLAASLGKRMASAEAASALDPPERTHFDAGGLVSIALTRRRADDDLDDEPFAPTTDISSLASLSGDVFGLVWQLADDPAMPARLHASADEAP